MIFEAGDYVEFNTELSASVPGAKTGQFPLNHFPYKVERVEWNSAWDEYVVGIRDYGQLWAVRFSHCYKVRPPKPTLLQKELAAMENDPWRKLRDEFLTKVFRPEPREKPAPAPTSVDFDWRDM